MGRQDVVTKQMIYAAHVRWKGHGRKCLDSRKTPARYFKKYTSMGFM